MTLKRSEIQQAFIEMNANNDVEKRYWSHFPGNFVDPKTGKRIQTNSENKMTILDCYNTVIPVIHQLVYDLCSTETPVSIYVAPDVVTIFEHLSGFYPPPNLSFSNYSSPEEYTHVGNLFQAEIFSNFYHWTNHIFVCPENINSKMGVIFTDILGEKKLGE